MHFVNQYSALGALEALKNSGSLRPGPRFCQQNFVLDLPLLAAIIIWA